MSAGGGSIGGPTRPGVSFSASYQAWFAFDAESQAQTARFVGVAPERPAPVGEPEPGGGRDADHVAAVVAAVGDERDAVELGHPGQIEGVG